MISQGRSRKLILSLTDTASPSSSSVSLSELASDAEYILTVDAGTQAGYNDSLHLQTIFIPLSADGLFLLSADRLCLNSRANLRLIPGGELNKQVEYKCKQRFNLIH